MQSLKHISPSSFKLPVVNVSKQTFQLSLFKKSKIKYWNSFTGALADVHAGREMNELFALR
jgi:hypothetical protein